MKKLALFIMSLTCVLLLSSCNKMIFESNGDGTCSVKPSDEFSEKEIVIPSESPKGDTVTEISSNAFIYCEGLTSVTIPDSVLSIGGGAFGGCSRLTTVYYAGTEAEWSKISIGSDNSNLTDATRYYYSETEPTATGDYWHYDKNGDIVIWPITFSEGLRYTLDTNGTSYTVTGIGTCTDKDMKIPPTYNGKPVTDIGVFAFRGCSRLTSVTIPDSILSIDSSAFSYCQGLTSVTIGNGVTVIGAGAFYDCPNLTTVYYAGTKTKWSKISIGLDNSDLAWSTRYYYSETEPTAAGNYWHYDENGKVAVW